ncbi:MAG TPA: MBL fold metallo-hydrolase [Vicinamibacteria bacterium]|nr:MBL fold metallo-hydrolase [Vicinamibacteria bacterium]
MRITMVGHSTVLIEVAGTRILTDPYFGSWGNPAYARREPPAATREALREVDLVLLSHNHWDHRDDRFFRSLPARTPVLAPGRSAWLTRIHGGRRVIGMTAWQQRPVGALTITAVPAVHMAATIGFVIQGGDRTAYFAGDTYHSRFMARIGEHFRPHVALIPVTTYRIPMTMGEKGALRAVRDLRPAVVIPIHLGLEPRLPWLRTGESPEGFARRVREAGLPTRVAALRPGETWRAEPAPTAADAAEEALPPAPVVG